MITLYRSSPSGLFRMGVVEGTLNNLPRKNGWGIKCAFRVLAAFLLFFLHPVSGSFSHFLGFVFWIRPGTEIGLMRSIFSLPLVTLLPLICPRVMGVERWSKMPEPDSEVCR
jgi:hypothetical protein